MLETCSQAGHTVLMQSSRRTYCAFLGSQAGHKKHACSHISTCVHLRIKQAAHASQLPGPTSQAHHQKHQHCMLTRPASRSASTCKCTGARVLNNCSTRLHLLAAAHKTAIGTSSQCACMARISCTACAGWCTLSSCVHAEYTTDTCVITNSQHVPNLL